jgi:hypothetical protein
VDIVAMVSAFKGALSLEYIEALTRASEVYCALSERVEKAYMREQGEDVSRWPAEGRPESEEDIAAVEKLQADAFIELVMTVRTRKPEPAGSGRDADRKQAVTR